MTRIVDFTQARERQNHKRKEAKVSALRDALAAARGESGPDPAKQLKSIFKRGKKQPDSDRPRRG